jgi:hypothetical protein
MIRYTLFVLTVLGSAATALAAIAPVQEPTRNITVIEKNDPFPVLGPLVFEDCATEDCSDTL